MVEVVEKMYALRKAATEACDGLHNIFLQLDSYMPVSNARAHQLLGLGFIGNNRPRDYLLWKIRRAKPQIYKEVENPNIVLKYDNLTAIREIPIYQAVTPHDASRPAPNCPDSSEPDNPLSGEKLVQDNLTVSTVLPNLHDDAQVNLAKLSNAFVGAMQLGANSHATIADMLGLDFDRVGQHSGWFTSDMLCIMRHQGIVQKYGSRATGNHVHYKLASGAELAPLPAYAPTRPGVSLGESQIARLLFGAGYSFVHQHAFADCRDMRPLPFDFYLPEQQVLIEVDGEQHYKRVLRFHPNEGDFERGQQHDAIKTAYAADSGYRLLRVRSLAGKLEMKSDDILRWIDNAV